MDADSAAGTATTSSIAVFGAAALTIALFALTPVTTRLAVSELDSVQVGLLRTVGGGLLALPLLIIQKASIPTTWRDRSLLGAYSLLSFAAFPILFSVGARVTSATHAGLIMAAMPVFIGLTGMVVDRRSPRLSWFIGALVALGGEFGLIGSRDSHSTTDVSLLGDLLVLLACISFSLGVVAGTKLTASKRNDSWATTFWAIVLATVTLLPFLAFTIRLEVWPALSPWTWASLLHLTLGAAVVANVAWLWALARGGIVRVAPLQFGQPVLALVFAILLLGEQITVEILGFAFVIIFGVVIAVRSAGRPSVSSLRLSQLGVSVVKRFAVGVGAPSKTSPTLAPDKLS
jgi:drug/metabolite transporter (DMT)-like permease